MAIERPSARARIFDALSVHPAVALTGPRQCGKTTLAREIASTQTGSTFFDLERAVDRRRLLQAPEQTLVGLSGLVVIDEIQREPALFETLRVLVDRAGNPARFLILGSASPALVRGASESLAGRVGLVDLSGFDLAEVGPGNWHALWQRGGFPRAYLAPSDRASSLWRQSFLETFLRDIPQLGITVPATILRRFWTMLAHYHGQVWNAAEFARALGSSEGTARRYLDILTGAFVVRALQPWFVNIKKRQVKSPKIYVRDTGLLHALLSLETSAEVAGHPKVGASFEGFVVEQLVSAFEVHHTAYFWATHGGAEIDLLITRGGKNYGFECKLSDAPGTTRSMRVALADLALEHLWVVYPGHEAYPLDERISVLPVANIPELARSLGVGDARLT